MRITPFATLSLLALPFALFSQNEVKPDSKKQTMLGINITNTLAGFFNSGGQEIPKDPFIFSLKVLKDNKVWRFGANAQYDDKDEDLNGGFLTTKLLSTKFRLGREWVMPLHKRFELYYGVDAVGTYDLETSKFSFNSELVSKDYLFGVGAGPFLGVYFKLGEHVRLSTETYAYGIYYYGERLDEVGIGIPDQKKRISRFTFLPAMPNSLFVHFIF